jgi:hypothetical protein
MLDAKAISESGTGRDGYCDVRIWSKDCEHKNFNDIGDKYRCDVCETIPVLNHEVHRAAMPYVSGDYDNLS